MLSRSLAVVAFSLVITGLVLAEDTRGTITKIEDGTITVRTGGFARGGKGGAKGGAKAEEKTFKVSKDVKISRIMGKDKEAVKLTLAELKTAVKVTNVFATISHDGEIGTEIKVGGFGFGGGGRGKKDKKDDK